MVFRFGGGRLILAERPERQDNDKHRGRVLAVGDFDGELLLPGELPGHGCSDVLGAGQFVTGPRGVPDRRRQLPGGCGDAVPLSEPAEVPDRTGLAVGGDLESGGTMPPGDAGEFLAGHLCSDRLLPACP
jgi:hypothetical protein